MTQSQAIHYKIFMASTTPVGLYARQRWLGQEDDPEWKRDFDYCVAELQKGQLRNGSWDNSFTQTVHRLFGLHLTIRHPTDYIDKALDWLYNKTKHADENTDMIDISDLRRIPFVPGKKYLLCMGMTLFLATIFGRDSSSEIVILYEKLSQYFLQNKRIWENYSDISNTLRAFVVHPVYSQSNATISIIEGLSKIQDNSGKWGDSIPFFQMVNALAHLNHPVAEMQLERAFLLLRKTQNRDGTWGDADREWDTFLVVHAMKNKKILK